LVVIGAACSATVGQEGVANVPGEEVWKTDLDLQLGERAIVDSGRLEVTLVSVGVDEATVLVDSQAGRRRETLRVGPSGSLVHPPYEIRLLSTGIDESATLQIRRQWGQY
jgi:hypothetical protein